MINNEGYTIERAIHGPNAEYNDITTWNHQKLLEFFGADDGPQCSYTARTKQGLDSLLLSRDFAATPSTKLRLVEVFLPKMDIPWRLKMQIDIINTRRQVG